MVKLMYVVRLAVKRMKHFVAIVIILSILTTIVFSNAVSALTDNERSRQGYSHGCSDAKMGGHPYLNSHPTHTAIFMAGYNDGYASCSSGNTQRPSAITPANRNNLFSDLNNCKAIEKYLIHLCNYYVNSKGVLTQQGKIAKQCISNGLLLSGVGLIGRLQPLAIIGILEPASERTGCGGIVKWTLLKSDVAAATLFLQLLQVIP